MISILIVDDEKIDRDAYKLMIKKSLPELYVTGEGDSGIAAVEKCIELKPDILLIDLKMPGLSGLDAIKIIRESNSDIKIIILSAYDYFEYAKSALSLGVEEYLLKPVSQSELTREVAKAAEQIERERRSIQKKAGMMKTVNDIVPGISKGIVHAIRGNDVKTIELLAGVLGKEIGDGWLVLFAAVQGVFSEDILDYMREISRWVEVAEFFSETVILIMVGTRGCTEERVQAMAAQAGKRFHVQIESGWAQYHTAGELHQKLFEVLYAVLGKQDRQYEHRYSVELEYKLINLLLAGKSPEAIEVLEQMISLLSPAPEEEFMFVKLAIHEVCLKIERLRAELEQNEEGEERPGRAYEASTDFRRWKQHCCDVIFEICMATDGSEAVKYFPKVMPILEYIEGNYCADIPLTQLAGHFFISPGYLGKLLRDATAMNYTEYVTCLRIKKAKELLRDGVFSIREISDKVGYNDSNYFIKVFKKSMGMTPREYRKQETGI